MDVASEQVKSNADSVAQNLGAMGHKAVDAAQKRLQNVTDGAAEYYERGMEKAGVIQDNMEEYVREQPLKSVMIALGAGLGAGLLIGMFLSRR